MNGFRLTFSRSAARASSAWSAAGIRSSRRPLGSGLFFQTWLCSVAEGAVVMA